MWGRLAACPPLAQLVLTLLTLTTILPRDYYESAKRCPRMSLRLKALLTLIALPAFVLAQSFTASVRGVVTDASHSAIPDAKVTITDTERNVSQKVTTDSAGRYVFAALPPGR